MLSMYFFYYLPLEKITEIHLYSNLSVFYPRMLFPQFDHNWRASRKRENYEKIQTVEQKDYGQQATRKDHLSV